MKVKTASVVCLTLLGLMTGIATSADHFDSPLANRDVRKDITDIYAFRSPENSDNLVVVMNVSPHVPGAAPSPLFSNNARYNVYVDNNGDLMADATVTVTFDGVATQIFHVTGLGKIPITGMVTPAGSAPIVAQADGIKVYSGPREDPFFFDLVGFKAFVSGPYVPVSGLRAEGAGDPSDTFAGKNVGSIVIELPITALTGGTDANSGVIRAWATITEPETK